jgi:phage terminase large subunit-like protein
MKAGPKSAPDPSPLPFRSRAVGGERIAAFAKQFIAVPTGKSALRPLVLRPWQIALVDSIMPTSALPPRLAGWMLPRGQGKSTLCAVLGLFDLMLGEEGARIVCAACDERQAALVFGAAVRMVEVNPDLESRVQVFQDRLEVPARGASFQVLPAVARRLEGLNPSLAIVDEAGRVDREMYEVISLASGKREHSTVLAIGTPGPELDESVLGLLRIYGLEHPEDDSFVWREHSAAGFEDHPVDCAHCWRFANPALGDFLYESGLRAVLPPKMREATFRRARLCQLVDMPGEPWLPEGTWDACAVSPTGDTSAKVALAFDGSYNGDASALVSCTVGDAPHLELLELWEPRDGKPISILAVEQAIRDACQTFDVVEITADPFRWARSLEILRDEGLPVTVFPQSAARMTSACSRFFEHVVNEQLTHSGDKRLAAHIGNCTLKEDSRGARIVKDSKGSRKRIDAAVAAVMALDVAANYEAPVELVPLIGVTYTR